jgi:hypothetical protein
MVDWWPGDLWPGYVVAALVSAAVGVADILARYKDDPWQAIRTRASAGYVVANLVFGLAAFWFAIVLDLVDVRSADGPVDPLRDGLLVGFAAVLVLRAVAFNINVGGKTDQVGPSAIVDTLLAACDQGIDRKLACQKDKQVRTMMEGVSFNAAKTFLPVYCLSLMQNTEGTADRIAQLIGSIEQVPDLTDEQRAYLLGNTLIAVFGAVVAGTAVNGFKPALQAQAQALGQPPPPPAA